MVKCETKTKFTKASVADFLAAVEPTEKRADAKTLDRLFRKVTGLKPRMWGPTIVGFGSYHYKYATGHEGDSPAAGFSPRKPNLTLYLVPDFDGGKTLMGKLGKHSISKSCLYIKRLSEVDMGVLEELVTRSVAAMQARERNLAEGA
ncbi:MAG: DUF1801 domain-containing protein [Cucumibacter sp.]